MQKSNIEWCDYTWNPVSGCSKVSQGCKNCYAETIANRFWKDRKFTDVKCHENKLLEPLKVKKGGLVFVNSMSDLFHEDVPFEFIDEVFHTIELSVRHTFIILTKRPKRMNEYFVGLSKCLEISLPNVWLGVSVEDHETAKERIPWLLKTPAAQRMVSVEPLLDNGVVLYQNYDYTKPPWISIDWVICGCESGPKRREAKKEWIESLQEQCDYLEIPFYLKQMEVDGKVVKKPFLNGKQYLEMPGVI